MFVVFVINDSSICIGLPWGDFKIMFDGPWLMNVVHHWSSASECCVVVQSVISATSSISRQTDIIVIIIIRCDCYSLLHVR